MEILLSEELSYLQIFLSVINMIRNAPEDILCLMRTFSNLIFLKILFQICHKFISGTVIYSVNTMRTVVKNIYTPDVVKEMGKCKVEKN